MFSHFLKKNKNTDPAYEKKRFFIPEEEIFYDRLRRALPDCTIFPKVDLQALIAPRSQDSQQQRVELAHIHGRKVDYAVFDEGMGLLCVIELSPPEAADGQSESNASALKSAGIKSIRWSQHGMPSSEQIRRALASFAPAKPDFSARTSGANISADSVGGAAPAAAMATAADDPLPQPASALSLAALEKLTPHAHIKTHYPHAWQRICLICCEPKYLEKYLETLSIQDRGAKRGGFSPEAIKEVAAIQSENQRFLTVPHLPARWNTSLIGR